MKPWVFLGVTEGAVTLAAQAQILPENLISILAQLPLVAVIIWLQLQNQKWLEHMLEVQRNSLKEIYDGQRVFLNSLLAQIEAKQNKLIDHVELLTQQVAICTATVGEIAKVDDVIDRLLSEVRRN